VNELTGRVALVSGGGRGIGAAISELLAQHGATVAVNYHRDAESAAGTVQRIADSGGSAAAYQASVDDPDQCAQMVDAVLSDLGGVDAAPPRR
jgi:NAD(P)-dependent dehydrogenase (short-subunit alcohol dehydrogenase family)